jgi:hypothetical protein
VYIRLLKIKQKNTIGWYGVFCLPYEIGYRMYLHHSRNLRKCIVQYFHRVVKILFYISWFNLKKSQKVDTKGDFR